MGWLRDLMRAARPPIKSFDELAARCLGQANWPPEVAIQKRSLGTLFGKLDRELELDWLTNRPSVQVVLASVLGISREELLLAYGPDPRRPGGRYLQLDSLPTGRPLDLAREPLFPGLPALVLTPANWEALWWVAPSGAGRSLVGAWLRAQGLLGPEEEPGSRVYLELDRSEELPSARPGLCVAAPFAPPEGSGFKLVRSAPLAATLPALVDWAADRLPGGGRFDRDELCACLAGAPLREGWLDSAGAVLGLVGLAEELGVAELERHSGSKLARLYLRRRSRELLDPDAASTDWIRRAAADALVALLRRSIVDAEEPWWVARSVEAWAELLPGELRRGADLEWLKLAFSQAEAGIRPRDLERAAKKLPPGAFRVLRALGRLGVLVPEGEERLALRPHWLVSALTVEATLELSRAAPSDFGEALLRPHAAPRVAQALFERALAEDATLIDEVLDLEPNDSPALAAAVEGVVRSCGLALLRGVELDPETAEGLLTAALELAVPRPPLALAPRIEHRALTESTSLTPLGQALLSDGAYQLALLALADEVPERRRFRSERARQARTLTAERLAVIEQTLLRFPELAVAPRAARLCGRYELEGDHAIVAPARVLRHVRSKSLRWEQWQLAVSSAFGQAALLGELELAPQQTEALSDAVWAAWLDAERPELPELDPRLNALIWSFAPPDALEYLAWKSTNEAGFEHLRRDQWRTLSACLVESKRVPESLAFWRAVPEPELDVLLERGLEPTTMRALEVLWQRAPARVIAALEARFEPRSKLSARALLSSVPAALTAETARKLATDERLSRYSSARLIELEAWLHERVAVRSLGWRDAYARLVALERRLAPARL